MLRPRILVVDDLPEKLRYLSALARRAQPECELVQAATAQEAFRLIETGGHDAFFGGLIDFDLGGGVDGGNIIDRLRTCNPLSRIALATARNEKSFEDEAKPVALHAGANEALSTCQEDFEQRVGMVLAA